MRGHDDLHALRVQMLGNPGERRSRPDPPLAARVSGGLKKRELTRHPRIAQQFSGRRAVPGRNRKLWLQLLRLCLDAEWAKERGEANDRMNLRVIRHAFRVEEVAQPPAL